MVPRSSHLPLVAVPLVKFTRHPSSLTFTSIPKIGFPLRSSMDLSVFSSTMPLFSRPVKVTATTMLLTPTISVTSRTKRCRSVVVVKGMGGEGGGGGSAKYKGTQMREKKLTELIEAKVVEARQVCEGDRDSDECKVAWDEVEEVSQAKADLRRKLDEDKDPLQSFCQENPETDECRIYED